MRIDFLSFSALIVAVVLTLAFLHKFCQRFIKEVRAQQLLADSSIFIGLRATMKDIKKLFHILKGFNEGILDIMSTVY